MSHSLTNILHNRHWSVIQLGKPPARGTPKGLTVTAVELNDKISAHILPLAGERSGKLAALGGSWIYRRL